MKPLTTLLILTLLSTPAFARGKWKRAGTLHEKVKLRVVLDQNATPELRFRSYRWGEVRVRDNKWARLLLEHMDFLEHEQLEVGLSGYLWRHAKLGQDWRDEERALEITRITGPAWTDTWGYVFEDAAHPGKLGLTQRSSSRPVWRSLDGPLVELLRTARGRKVRLRGWQLESRFVPLQVCLAGREDSNWDLEYSIPKATFVLDGAPTSAAALEGAQARQQVQIWHPEPVRHESRPNVTATLRTLSGTVVWDAMLLSKSSSPPLALQIQGRAAPLQLVHGRRVASLSEQPESTTAFPHLTLFEGRPLRLTGLHVTVRKHGAIERDVLIVESVEPQVETISGEVVADAGVSLRLESGQRLRVQDWVRRGGPPVRSQLTTLLRANTRVSLEGYRFSDHFLLIRIRASYRYHPGRPALWISQVSARDGVSGVEVSHRDYPRRLATKWHRTDDLRWEQESRSGLSNALDR